MTYINVGPFAKSGFALPIPVLEKFWRRAESWEKPFGGVRMTRWKRVDRMLSMKAR